MGETKEEIQLSEKNLNSVEVSVPSTPIESESGDGQAAHQHDVHVNLSWRSWVVVLISCFAVLAQVFVVVGSSNVIAFIIRDLGDPAIVGWIIQGPLLIQATLSPIVGRLSDIVDRRYLVSIPPLIAFVGAVISAKAQDMATLIGGGILIGVTLTSISITQAIPAEVLPLKYRSLSQGLCFIAGSLGGLLGVLGGGGLTNTNANGWRGIYWLQAGLHLATSLGFLAFYWPARPADRPRKSIMEVLWAMDPIGSFLFMSGTALMLLALDWAGGTYQWHQVQVAAPLGIGMGLTVLFGVYEWLGRKDGLVAHVFFKGNNNFALSTFAFAVEGWIFFSAVNSVTTQIILNLGFENSAWRISIRQLSFNLCNLFASVPIIWWATKRKDIKTPLYVTFVLFLITCICYSFINPSMSKAQYGFNVMAGIGQAGPLTLLIALVQYTAPHAYLANATGLAFSARAIGGAFGSAVVNVIINSKLGKTLGPQVSSAAIKAGLSASSIPALMEGMATGNPVALAAVPGISPSILGAAFDASHHAYAGAYRLAWASIIPFVVLALVAIIFVKGVQDLMTEEVEATVEHVSLVEEKTV
ncbi:major facilitator superfamily domain-containing protein [Hyaloscypha finlandica]|nr:major facilitator superfamily domain-containing protein [Hyaloscypha sp. PMI_1271]KAH8780769.1 major facilitator superfamily domain-containing protein [Hyaloscypha finlandica]